MRHNRKYVCSNPRIKRELPASPVTHRALGLAIGLAILQIALSISTIGCTSSSEEGFYIGWPMTLYLSFIEAIEYPDEVAIGEEFTVKLTLSSRQNSELLNGLPTQLGFTRPYMRETGFPYGLNISEFELTIYTWIKDPPMAGTPNNVVEIPLRFGIGTVPGDRELIFYSAKSRESGGTVLSGNIYPPAYHENGEFFTYPITVLPAEDTPAGDG
jgi:hypothetical protein